MFQDIQTTQDLRHRVVQYARENYDQNDFHLRFRIDQEIEVLNITFDQWCHRMTIDNKFIDDGPFLWLTADFLKMIIYLIPTNYDRQVFKVYPNPKRCQIEILPTLFLLHFQDIDNSDNRQAGHYQGLVSEEIASTELKLSYNFNHIISLDWKNETLDNNGPQNDYDEEEKPSEYRFPLGRIPLKNFKKLDGLCLIASCIIANWIQKYELEKYTRDAIKSENWYPKRYGEHVTPYGICFDETGYESVGKAMLKLARTKCSEEDKDLAISMILEEHELLCRDFPEMQKGKVER